MIGKRSNRTFELGIVPQTFKLWNLNSIHVWHNTKYNVPYS